MNRYFLILFFILFVGGSEAQNLAAPSITCVSTDENTGDVTINWLPSADSCGPFVAYIIYGHTDTNPFLLIDTVFNPDQLSVFHPGANGTATTWFYTIQELQLCDSTWTFLWSDTVTDQVLNIPMLEYVTVVPGGVEIHWQASLSTYTAYYLIEMETSPGIYVVVDTVFGRMNNSYFDVSFDPQTEVHNYEIRAVDSCDFITDYTLLPHNNIQLDFSVNACAQEMTLTWNPYLNWTDGVLEYQLWIGMDGATPTLETQIAATQTNYTFDLSNISGDSLCVYVSAIQNLGSFSSESNVLCRRMDLLQSTSFNYITNVTVVSDKQVEVTWRIDVNADLQTVEIFRGTNAVNLAFYQPIDLSQPLNAEEVFTDAGVNAQSTAYFYEVRSSDVCDFDLASQTANSILLKGKALTTGFNKLTWNPFDLQYATIANYTIYREIAGTMSPIATVPDSELSYEDEIATDLGSTGSFCYFVEANYQIDLPTGISETHTSRSNLLCVEQEPIVVMPNAFIPSSNVEANQTLKPVLVFDINMDYSMTIFDRWGKKQFETTARHIGWRGNVNAEDLPMGAYIWVIKLTAPSGNVYEHKGTVLLIR